MQEAKLKGPDIINSLSREEFHKKYVKGICQTAEFSTLASFWAEDTPEDYKEKVRNELAKLGIPHELTASDDDLDNVVTAITGRSVTLR